RSRLQCGRQVRLPGAQPQWHLQNYTRRFWSSCHLLPDVDFTCHGSGDEGGAVLPEFFDVLANFGDKAVDFGSFTVDIGRNDNLLGKRWLGKPEVSDSIHVDMWGGCPSCILLSLTVGRITIQLPH